MRRIATVTVTAAVLLVAGCSSTTPTDYSTAWTADTATTVAKVEYPTSGDVTGKIADYVGGVLCDTTAATFDGSTGRLELDGVQPVTMWSAQFVDKQGEPIVADDDLISGTVGYGDPLRIEATISAATAGATAAVQVTMTGATDGMCVVLP